MQVWLLLLLLILLIKIFYIPTSLFGGRREATPVFENLVATDKKGHLPQYYFLCFFINKTTFFSSPKLKIWCILIEWSIWKRRQNLAQFFPMFYCSKSFSVFHFYSCQFIFPFYLSILFHFNNIFIHFILLTGIYFKNQPLLGIEKNCLRKFTVVKMPNSIYTWKEINCAQIFKCCRNHYWIDEWRFEGRKDWNIILDFYKKENCDFKSNQIEFIVFGRHKENYSYPNQSRE